MLDCVIFIIPCLLFIEVRLIGRLFGSELLILALFPFVLLVRGKALAAPTARTFLILGLLWLANQVVTDLILDTPFRDYTRGWAKIGFTIINFATLYMLLHDSRRRVLIFAVGLGIGGLLDHFISPGVLARSDPWKFGLGLPVTLLMVLGAQHVFERSNRLLVPAGLCVLTVIHFVMGFRSLGGITFLAAVLLFFQWRRARPRFTLSPGRLALVAGLAIIPGVAVLEGYSYAATTGMLGAYAQRKYEFQAAGEYGVFLGGRTEIIVAGQAIFSSPIIGHGSWAKNKEYASMLYTLKGYSAQVKARLGGSDLIPSHSHIFGAWVEAGIFGAVFWFAMLWMVMRVVAQMHLVPGNLAPLVAYICVLVAWDVLFSPYGAQRRLFMPYHLVLLLFVWEQLLAIRREQVARPRRREQGVTPFRR